MSSDVQAIAQVLMQKGLQRFSGLAVGVELGCTGSVLDALGFKVWGYRV